LSGTSCESRIALCPQSTTANPQTSFYQTEYARSTGFLFPACGPSGPIPICSATVPDNANLEASNLVVVDNVCNSMQAVDNGNKYSPDGVWAAGANANLASSYGIKSADIKSGVTATGGVRYFFFNKKDDDVWIVFLGSQSAENWQFDFKTALVSDANLNMSFHTGFYGAATSIYEDLKSFIGPVSGAKNIHLTGHSLGAAVANISSLLLANDGYTISSLVTFGQPQVTNADGAAVYNTKFAAKIPLLRVINEDDIVPFVTGYTGKDYEHFGPSMRMEKAAAEKKGTFAVLEQPDGMRINWNTGVKAHGAAHQTAAYTASLNDLFCQGSIK
ncbi:MAG: lipase family protein, partial [bacterium]|nr:lipase family protein [bacterium]